VFELDLGSTLKVTCARCGTHREMPEDDGRGRLPAASPDGATTLQADTPCRCGSERVKIELDFGDCEETEATEDQARER
jgi:hypothetical protein